jgi:small subunit ribosomal protein S8
MRVTDPIADMLTRVRNGLMAKKVFVSVPSSKLKLAVAKLLEEEGYVESVSVDETAGAQGEIKIVLKYWKGNEPVIAGLRRVSKPGRRQYVKSSEIPKVLGGLGICILTTSKGVMTGQRAAKDRVGGEVLCEVW